MLRNAEKQAWVENDAGKYQSSSDLEYRWSNDAEAEEFARLAKDKPEEMSLKMDASQAHERFDFMHGIVFYVVAWPFDIYDLESQEVCQPCNLRQYILGDHNSD